MDYDALFKTAVGGVAVAAATAVPAVYAVVSQIRSRAPKDNFYEDKDGVATPESIAAFSNKASKFAVAFLASSTAALSIALSVLTTLHPGKHDLFWPTWLTTGAWVSTLPLSLLVSILQTAPCHANCQLSIEWRGLRLPLLSSC